MRSNSSKRFCGRKCSIWEKLYLDQDRAAWGPRVYRVREGSFGPPASPPYFTAVERSAEGGFRLGYEAPGGRVIRIQVSTDLAQWQDLVTILHPGGSGQFTDADAGSSQSRFYRLVMATGGGGS